ncbi:hypothetical protein BCR34DRAFT_585217 [Clohesyomyces aquaticus]|uniref:DUF7702 domain-containing protein n=1 Tax=Clohesyomyces aquaticus TaxID=1231657 RepID=A0A1Y1ZZ46_9PLEO|nr:hypothetical protein BCR34DRAFT_585217 [Clohesyomyces aquaticus]
MHLTKRGDVAVAELIIFIPALISAVLVCIRHGFKKTQGWIFILILCVIRIAGSVCQLIADNKPGEAIIKTTLVFESVGIAPLLLSTLGLLSRMVDWINACPSKQRNSPHFTPKHFTIIQITIGAGLVLGVVGVTSMDSSSATKGPPVPSKVGIIVYIAGYLVLFAIYAFSLRSLSALPTTEKPLVVHIPLVLVALAIRIAYSTLCVFWHNGAFNLFDGSIAADVLMAVTQEAAVVILVLALGFRLKRIGREEEGEITRRGKNKGRRGGGGDYSTGWRRGARPEGTPESIGCEPLAVA